MSDFLTIAAAAFRVVVLAAQAGAVVAVVALVAVLVYGAARFARARHRAGVARLAAYDAATVETRRRARRNARTVVDVDTAGTVRAVTVEPRRTR